jgi:hypothetical protein
VGHEADARAHDRLKLWVAAVALAWLYLAVPAETVQKAAEWAEIVAVLVLLHDHLKKFENLSPGIGYELIVLGAAAERLGSRKGIQSRCRFAFVAGYQVAVDVVGGADVGVADVGLDLLGIQAGGDEVAGAGVAGFVGGERGERLAGFDFDAGVIRVEGSWDDVEGEIDGQERRRSPRRPARPPASAGLGTTPSGPGSKRARDKPRRTLWRISRQ